MYERESGGVKLNEMLNYTWVSLNVHMFLCHICVCVYVCTCICVHACNLKTTVDNL